MRSRWILQLAVLTGVMTFPSAPSRAGESEKKESQTRTPHRVYFIGHSLYGCGNVPSAVQFLSEAAAVDRPIKATVYLRGGATHQNYWETPEVMNRLRQEPWDIVIIAGNCNDMANPEQGQSGICKEARQRGQEEEYPGPGVPCLALGERERRSCVRKENESTRSIQSTAHSPCQGNRSDPRALRSGPSQCHQERSKIHGRFPLRRCPCIAAGLVFYRLRDLCLDLRQEPGGIAQRFPRIQDRQRDCACSSGHRLGNR